MDLIKADTSMFLSLPQELRDLIVTYAVTETLPSPKEYIESPKADNQLPLMVSALQDQDRFRYLYPKFTPQPTWYNLLRTSKTTNQDIKNLSTTSPTQCVTMDLEITSSTAKASITSLPSNPNTLKDLKINIRLCHLWDESILSTDLTKDNKILRSLFTVLKRYILYGPHFSRSSPLPTPLHLENVIIDVNPAFSAEEAMFFFGNPTQQLGRVCDVLMTWLGRFARSGLLWEKVEKMKWRNEWVAGDVVELQYAVTCDIWDEADFVVFKDLGYKW